MRFACWITKATHSEYVILINFHAKNSFVKATQCCVISAFCVLFLLIKINYFIFEMLTKSYGLFSQNTYTK